jgi:hypothetical protein
MIDKQIVLTKLTNNPDREDLLFEEGQYLASLVRNDIMMDEFFKLFPVNLNR